MQYKKKLSVVLLLAFLMTMVIPVTAFAASFSDVPGDHWAIQQIDRMNARTIIGGYEDGTARPNNPVTQFEAILMASRMMGLEYDASKSKGTYLPFKYPDWDGAYGSAVAAYEAGLIDVNDFNHSAAASRQWIAKLLIKALKAESEVAGAASQTLSFGDAGSISSEYLNYVKLAYDKGLIGGYTDGTFKPKNTVTRAEMAAFMCRVEDKLNANIANVVRGEITAVNGVTITIDGTDGKTYTLYATTTSVLYNKNSQKIGVTGLAVGDPVYAVYKNSLLSYLEVRNGVTAPVISVKTNLAGKIESVIAAKNTIVISDEDGVLQTVILTKDSKINKESSTVALAISDLLQGMAVRVAVDSDQIASQIIIMETANGQKTGSIYNVDVYNNLIIMNEKTGLKTYHMSKNIDVSIAGMLTATTSSLKEGDQATYTIADGIMTAIAVGGSSDSFGGNATVKSIDATNRIVNYTTSSNELKAAYYDKGFTVKFKNGENGTISDLQVGDSIKITVDNNQIKELVVTSRNITDGLKGTLYSVNATDKLIVITDSNGTKQTYNLANNVRVSLYGESTSLGNLVKGMNVQLTLQNNEVIRISANDLVEGTVESIKTSGTKTIQVKTANGVETYNVSNNVRINFYKTTSTSLSSLKLGDTVSMKVVNDEVTVINSNETVEMTVVDVYSGSNWVRLQDYSGSKVTAYIDDVDLIVDGIHSSYASDLTIGAEATVTFTGSVLTKIEAASKVKGEITKISGNTLTVRTFSNETKTVTVSGGTANYSVGDRILVNPTSGTSKTVEVMQSKTGSVRYATSGLIQFSGDTNGNSYKTVNGCYCHNSNSTTQFALTSLNPTSGQQYIVTIYFTDRDNVYEVVR